MAALCSGTSLVVSELRAVPAGAADAPVIPIAYPPVLPKCWYYDDFGAPRVGGRVHEGVDIGATLGVPVYAVVGGTITAKYLDAPGLRAGNALRLVQADGTYFFYAHMNGFAPGIGVGSRVNAGDVIGYVGQTGNALSPHLHLEIHPNGGAAINPFPSMKAVNICTGNGSVPHPAEPPAQPEPTPPAAPTPAPPPAPGAGGGSPVVGPAVSMAMTSPVRVVDTRSGTGGRRVAANTVTAFNVVGRGGISASANAALLEIFASSPSSSGYLVAFPCNGSAPVAASVSFGRGQLVGNLVHVGLANGKVCVRSSSSTDVIIDVVAADGSSGAAGMMPVAPTRLYDSRAAGGRLAAGEVRAINTAGVGAVPPSNGLSVTLTAVNAAKTGTLKIWPCDRNAPGLPVLVVTSGATASASALTRVAGDGTVCVSSSTATDVVLDATSVWALGGGRQMRAITPARVYDSRDEGGRVAGGSVAAVGIAGRGGVNGGAAAVSVSISATGSSGRGWVTVWPCGQNKPLTAAMMLSSGVTSSSTVIVGLGGGKLCLSPSASTHLIVDVTGYA